MRFDKPTLIITHSFPLSQDDYRGRFIEDLLPRDGEVPILVLTPDPSGSVMEVRGRVMIHRFHWPHGYLAGRRIYNPVDMAVFLKMLLIFVIRATKIVRAYNIQHVFACWAIPGGLVALLVRMITGKPYDVWALGTDVSKFKKIPLLLRTIFRFAARVYANSLFLKEQLRRLTGQAVEILPTRGVLPAPVTPSSPLAIPKGAVLVAFVGRLERVKGIDRFIAMARRIRKEKAGMLFAVFGEGSLRGLVEDAAREETVLWAGQVSPSELAYYAERIDLLCITSREESMPVVVWEFMGRCPILSFDVGDVAAHLPPEAIMHSEEEFFRRLMKTGKKGQ
jgi:glycosyltransferase involved in cell wall biosynthesis